MSCMKNYEYKVFETADFPESVAEFLNRNKFYIAKHKKISIAELNEVQKDRGIIFSVFAFDEDKCIGMVAGYPVAGQKVAKEHQLFMGTLIVDKYYVIRPSIISTLFKMAIEQIKIRKYREIISESSPNNKLSFDMLKRHGFALIDNNVDRYGYYELHNYLPAIFSFFGEDNLNNNIVQQEMYDYHFLPKVEKTKRFEKCTFYNEDTIVQTFNLTSDTIYLYININFGVVVGFDLSKGLSVIPSNDEYILANKSSTSISVAIEYDDVYEKVEVSSNEIKHKFIPIDKKVKITFLGRTFLILGNVITKLPIESLTYLFENNIYKIILQKSTGSLIVRSQSTDELLIIIPWSHFGDSYLQGAMKSRDGKILEIYYDIDCITISEEMSLGKISNTYELKEKSIIIKSDFRSKSAYQQRKYFLYNQLWINGFSGEYEQKLDFADYPLWIDNKKYLAKSVDILTKEQHFVVSTDNRFIVNLPSIIVTGDDLNQTELHIDF